MNKNQLVEAVAAELGASKAAAARATEAVIHCLARGIQHDQGVTLSGFGTFSRRQRPPRKGRNPVTGETIEIKASATVNFKPSQALKDTITRQAESPPPPRAESPAD